MGMTHEELQSMLGGLTILGNRFLPGHSYRTVATLIALVKPYAIPSSLGRIRVAQAVLDGYGGVRKLEHLSDLASKTVSLEIQRAVHEYDTEEIYPPIDISAWPRLVEDDLPRAQEGEGGWENEAQLAVIVADLGPLFTIRAT